MKPAKGFFLIESMAVFLLGIILLFAVLRTYYTCINILQKKLLVEEAFVSAQQVLANQPLEQNTRFTTDIRTLAVNDFALQELNIYHHGKVVLNLIQPQA